MESVGPQIDITLVTSTSWLLRATQTLRQPRAAVFPFFADASNLGRITPAEIGFRILTPTPIEMKEGAVIDYRIRLYGLWVRWQTLITMWNPPSEFVDIQVRGPYAEWVHRHRFTEAPDGRTIVDDEVHFRLPFARLGSVAAPLVKRQLRQIFTYRYAAITRAFSA